MLKPKILKLLLEEAKLSVGTPFTIEGESTPYRFKKDGTLERFKGKSWTDSSYSYLDLVCIIDAGRIHKYTEEIEEYSPIGKKGKKSK